MKSLKNISFDTINLHVLSDAQVNVVIYFPVDDDLFEERKSIFEALCRGLHFSNFSYLEMKGKKERENVKTQYYLYCDKWVERESSKAIDKRKNFKNFDIDKNSFRNYDFLDFHCELINGNKEDAHKHLQKLRSKEKITISFIDSKENQRELPTENELLRKIWCGKGVFDGLTDAEIEEMKCRLEHQHWCSDKLLCGFRALSKDELATFNDFRLETRQPISESAHWSMHKEMYQKKRMYASMKNPAHLDLCSFDELMLRDFSTVYHDFVHFDQITSCASKSASVKDCKPILWLVSHWKSLFLIVLLLFITLLFCSVNGIRHLFYGIVGAEIIVGELCWAYSKQNKMDRRLSDFNKTSLFGLVLFIMSIPIACAIMLTALNSVDICCQTHDFIQSVDDNFYSKYVKQFVDPGTPHMEERSKFLLALLGTLCLNGILVPSVMNIIERRVQNWREGSTRYNIRSKHVIIIGGHDMVPGILNQIDSSDIKYYIIMTEQECVDYRARVCAQVSEQIANKIIIYRGDRTSIKDIQSLQVNRTSLKAIYVVGEGSSHSELEPNHDSKNMSCVDLISKLRKDNNAKLRCYTMFEHRSSYVAFQQAELTDVYKERLMFEPFNIFEMCVQDILVMPKYPIVPIDVSRFSEDKKGKKNYIDMDSRRRVHIVIFGMSKIGMALASEAAIICHYPNYAKKELLEDHNIYSELKKEDLRLLITFIDLDAEQQMKFYQNRMPSLFEISKWKYMDGKSSTDFVVTDNMNQCPAHFEFANLIDSRKQTDDNNFIDVEWEFISGALGDVGVSKYLKDISKQENELLTIAVCLPDGDAGLSLASTMPVEIYDKAEQIFVYQRQADGIVKQMAGSFRQTPFDQHANRFEKLRPFGMYSTCFNQKLLDNDLATKIFSTNYKRLKKAIKENTPISKLCLEELSSLPIVERWSAVYSAHNWSVKFRSMGVISGDIPTKEQLEKEFGEKSPKVEHTDESHAYLWGRVEHNRWILERLIKIGERPLTLSENLAFKQDFKESYKKSANRSHIDICSMSKLRNTKTKGGKENNDGLDPGVVDYDVERNYRLVEIFEALVKK